jgi:hypothetical protein
MMKTLLAAMAALALLAARPATACDGDCKNCPHHGKACKCGETCQCPHCAAHKGAEKKAEPTKT